MMNDMLGRRRRPTSVSLRRSTPAMCALAALLTAACGDTATGEPTALAADALPLAAEQAVATAPASTSRPTSTTRATTTPTTSTPTTAPPTTLPVEPIVVTLPSTTIAGPVPPPVDEYAAEPVVEVGSIAIPELGVEMPMFEGIRLSTLDHGPGHWPGSAMPGEAGNVVVGGHRTSSHRVFRDIDRLASGDQIVFRSAGDEHVYAVDRVEIVGPKDVWIIDPTDTPTATLFACHPPGSTAQRIVVFADLVSP